MPSRSNKRTLEMGRRLAAGLLGLAAGTAAATPYTLELGGWTGGGVLTGGFVGSDLNADGFISSFDNEVTSFAATFTGNDSFAPFSFAQADLQGLVYRINGGPMGDDELPISEGLYASSVNFALLSGMGPAGEPGAYVLDLTAETAISTGATITISAVPEPQGWLLMLGGLVPLLGAATRKCKSMRNSCAAKTSEWMG